jgi:hypothetical protein
MTVVLIIVVVVGVVVVVLIVVVVQTYTTDIHYDSTIFDVSNIQWFDGVMWTTMDSYFVR